MDRFNTHEEDRHNNETVTDEIKAKHNETGQLLQEIIKRLSIIQNLSSLVVTIH